MMVPLSKDSMTLQQFIRPLYPVVWQREKDSRTPKAAFSVNLFVIKN